MEFVAGRPLSSVGGNGEQQPTCRSKARVNTDGAGDNDNTEQNKQGDAVKLERVLGLSDAIMMNVGCMVGSGIFISPRGVLAGIHSVGATLLIWVASGVLSLFGALCYAELGTMIPMSGGTYTYILDIFGSLPGFIYLWTDVVAVRPSLNAITALSFSYYCLQPFYSNLDCSAPEATIKLLAVACIMVLLFINCWSVKLTSRVINGTSIFKILALSFIILSGIIFICMGRSDNFANPFILTNVAGIGTGLYSGLYSYSGWQNLNMIVEEVKRPERNLPLAIFISLGIVTFVNTLTNVAYFTLLSPSELLRSNAVAFSYAAKFLGTSLSWIMAVVTALSLFGSLTAILFSTSRLVFAGARRGQFPKALAMISIRRKTPTPALVFLTLVSVSFCFVDNILILINFLTLLRWLSFGVATVGLVYLRVKQPERVRPYKVNILIPITFITACAFVTVTGTVAAPRDAAIGVGILFSAVPVYFLAVWSRTRNSGWLKSIVRGVTVYCQKIMLTVLEETKQG